MAKSNDTGVYQLENGLWGYRFVMVLDGRQVSSRKTTDEFGNKLKTKKQAIKAREAAMLQARLDSERKRETSIAIRYRAAVSMTCR